MFLETSGRHIDRSWVAPALDSSAARLPPDSVPPADVHAQGKIGKGDRGVKRCFFDHEQRKRA
jgi:hypothetical protein